MAGFKKLPTIALAVLLIFAVSCQKKTRDQERSGISIVTSDTILSGMVVSLMPANSCSVSAIMPPGQCPGHYDTKLSDIEKIRSAGLVLSFRGMPFMEKAEVEAARHFLVDEKGRNWMAPHSYVIGLELIAKVLSTRFPEHQEQISARRSAAIREISERSDVLSAQIRKAGVFGTPVIASSMQKEPLEWMGFRVVGEYGRPEAMSAKEMVRLSQLGREKKAVAVVDNLQSGPEAGKGLAEELHVPHVVLSNFPSERGYGAILSENVDAMITAVRDK
jgi:zinc transport system substrate-binding protein